MAICRDNAHFYRPPLFWGEPRFERPSLSTAAMLLTGGSASTSRNSSGNKESTLLNLYGFENLHHIGDNVPSVSAGNPLETLVNNLNDLPDRGTFGQVKYFGQFSLFEGALLVQQNFTKGFFGEVYMPIRQLKIEMIGFNDKTPADNIEPHRYTQTWLDFLGGYQTILAHYGLTAGRVETTGFGDITIMAGWTTNYQDTRELDYIDATIKTGILLPTGHEKNENSVFDLPTGYNGHYGFPFSIDASLGAFEWLTVGANLGGIIFSEKEKIVRMRTSSLQNGFIKLAKGTALVRPGTVWHLGAYVKLDHIHDAFSWTTAYSFNQRLSTKYLPSNTGTFPYPVVNGDEQLQSWSMHVIHIVWEFDLGAEGNTAMPNVTFLMNIPVGGQRIFNTMTGGAAGEVNMTWHF